MHCNNCGKENEVDMNFCMYCGANLEEKKVKRAKKRKKIFIIIPIVFIVILVLITKSYFSRRRPKVKYEGDIRNVSWGMTKEEVEKAEKFRTEKSFEEDSIYFELNKDEFIEGYKAELYYLFDSDEEVYRAELYIEHKSPRPGKELEYYEEIKKYFQNIYGKPEELPEALIKDMSDDEEICSWLNNETRIVLFYDYEPESFEYIVLFTNKDSLEEFK